MKMANSCEQNHGTGIEKERRRTAWLILIFQWSLHWQSPLTSYDRDVQCSCAAYSQLAPPAANFSPFTGFRLLEMWHIQPLCIDPPYEVAYTMAAPGIFICGAMAQAQGSGRRKFSSGAQGWRLKPQ